jgi:hypothetical protein
LRNWILEFVRIYILTQEGKFFVSLGLQIPGFGEDILGIAASFAAAGIGDYAIGAKIIASAGDGNES